MRIKMALLLITIVAVNGWCRADAPAVAPLADKVSAKSLFYVGWAGTDALGPAYDNSNTKVLVSQSNIPDVVRQLLSMVVDLKRWSPDDQKNAAVMKELWPLMWKHPTALLVQMDADDPSTPAMGLLCDGGDDAQTILADLKKLPHGDDHGSVTANANLVIVTRGKVDDASGNPLSSSTAFIAAMSHLNPTPALVVYLDGAGIIDVANKSAEKDDTARGIWPKVRDALGLTNFRTFAASGGFDGKNWMTASLLAAPAPRTGLFEVIEPKAIDPALLARVPKDAPTASAVTFDAAKLYDVIHSAFAANPDAVGGLDKVAGVASMTLGRNLRRQILGPLGDQWVSYSNADNSFFLLNKPKDPKAAQDALVTVTYALANLANSQFHAPAGQGPMVTASQQQIDGVTVTTVTTPQASPSWAIKDGILIFGTSAENVAKAANTAVGDQNVTQNPKFTTIRDQLGLSADSAFDFSYSDLPTTLPPIYSAMGPAYGMIRGLVSNAGVTLPDLKLPPVDMIKPLLSPAMKATWADANGIYSKSLSPFPAALAMGNPQTLTSVGGVALATSIMLPSLNRAREQANRVKCASNMRQIGMAMLLYANDHKGAYPPDLGSLLEEDITLDVFLCPDSNTSVPDEIKKAPQAEQAKWVNEHSDYVYHGAGRNNNDPADDQTLTEKPGHHGKDGSNVLFGDGHVEFVKPATAQPQIEKPDGPGI
jgi:prepilin-type processing-associated H-X9-DG protein